MNQPQSILNIKNQNENSIICKYSGVDITEDSLIDIDHIIPLKYAWLNGAAKWDDDKKTALATDLNNLVSVSEHENRSKGDDGLLLYLPPLNKKFYVTQWKTISEKYGIVLSKSEQSIINQYIVE